MVIYLSIIEVEQGKILHFFFSPSESAEEERRKEKDKVFKTRVAVWVVYLAISIAAIIMSLVPQEASPPGTEVSNFNHWKLNLSLAHTSGYSWLIYTWNGSETKTPAKQVIDKEKGGLGFELKTFVLSADSLRGNVCFLMGNKDVFVSCQFTNSIGLQISII